MTLKAVILKSRDCGMEVFRVMIWRDGALVLVQTRMSESGARAVWAEIQRRETAFVTSLHLAEVAA